MPKLTIVAFDGTEFDLDAEAGSTVMENAIKNAVPGIEAECGGACACATCHVYVDPAWTDKLPPRDPTLYFVQRLRDEAHRFAIGSHRAKRKREMVKNPLDEIAGIGPSRKRALLHHFGTVKAIQRAAFEDLAKTPGVNAATARAVYDFFHTHA